MAKTSELSLSWKWQQTCRVRATENLFDENNTLLRDVLREVTGSETPRVMLVADYNVVQHTSGIGVQIGKYLQAHQITLAAAPTIINGSEKMKTDNFQTYQRLLSAALDAKVGVNDVMLVLGGGSLLDLVGFVASQVRGGLKTVRVPTTTAAMIDGAFATYVALNSPNVKDAYRLANYPHAILIDPAFAKTLLDGVWRGGMSEFVRFASVADATFMKKLAKVAKDLRDKKEGFEIFRELLFAFVESRVKKGGSGFGLWCAHRMEAMSAYKLPHGYAVPLGMCVDSRYAREKGVADEKTDALIFQTLTDLGVMEGLSHSKTVFQRTHEIIVGLDSWRLANGSEALTLPTTIGKSTIDENPDRALYEKVLLAFANT